MKKVYVKPVLIKLGNLESFIEGTGEGAVWMDYYSNVCGDDFDVTKTSCGGSNVGGPGECGPDPASNYFVYSDNDRC